MENREFPKPKKSRFRLTVLGLLILVALIAVGLAVYRRRSASERPTLVAIYSKPSPITDGIIGPNEYGSGVLIQWTADNTLVGFEHRFSDPATNKAPDDLEVTMHAAYTDTSLFFAFRVRDQFVDAQEVDRDTPHMNDGVEIFLDGDRVPNDFDTSPQEIGSSGKMVPSEGFQLLVDAAGHPYTRCRNYFSDADWKRAAKRTADGYVIEVEIPLALIDTKDGPGVVPPRPGSEFNLALAFTDNDTEARQQMSYAYLRTNSTTISPFFGGESTWSLAVRLSSPWWQWSW